MYIIMLGAPGTGKGTIGKEITKKYNLTQFSTGDMFREEIKNNTKLGIEANKYISEGKLVPDDITISMVESSLLNLDNLLLDGFPRTIVQAEHLKRILNENGKSITAVIDLSVPDEDIIKRTASRVVCSNKNCRASFNTIFMPPKQEGICDICGSKLIVRDDDKPETTKKRLEIYYKNTEPLIDYYKNEGLLEKIDINIYSPTTKEDTTNKAFSIIDSRI